MELCIAVFFLYASIYLYLSGIAHPDAPLLFVAGMLAIGPFHAYLEDTYKRKHIFIYSALLLALTAVAIHWAEAVTGKWWWLIASVQGVWFGLAVTAGSTVAIDITNSPHRTQANIVYSFASRLGMLAGLAGGYLFVGSSHLMYGVAALSLLGGCFMLRIHVPFRSPIGMSYCNLDRYLLPSAWFPAFNTLLMAFALACFPLLLPLLLLLLIPMTRLFVNLSHHCQRGTANATLQIALDAGVLIGLSTGHDYSHLRMYLFAVAAAVAIWLFCFVSYPYYKRRRIR